ncbi:hypothetical protein AB3662_29835 [Sorangium cellulosum]|uniref:hypothetical protein n=1 Tax=Sorangium cellulosum TaxID=56 RepID=UPI003D9A1EBB
MAVSSAPAFRWSGAGCLEGLEQAAERTAARTRVGVRGFIGRPQQRRRERELFQDLRAPVSGCPYLGFLFAALRLEAPGAPAPPIETVAVVLSGRKRRLPATGKRCIAWPGRPFSGAHFRVDAVYQRTVAELRARGSVLWLVFAPLARNATAEALREVVAEIHAGAASAEERAELYTALLVMAVIDPWGHTLRKELIVMVEDKEEGLLRRTPIIGEMIIEAEQRGEDRGKQQAIAELLGRLFARRLGRRPTADEERSIVERARALGPGEVADALLDLEGEALVRWLAEPISPS